MRCLRSWARFDLGTRALHCDTSLMVRTALLALGTLAASAAGCATTYECPLFAGVVGALNSTTATCTYTVLATASQSTQYYCNAPATLSGQSCIETASPTQACQGGATMQPDGRCLTTYDATRGVTCPSGYTAFVDTFSVTDTPCYPNSFSCSSTELMGVNPSNVVGCYGGGMTGQAAWDPVNHYTCFTAQGGVSYESSGSASGGSRSMLLWRGRASVASPAHLCYPPSSLSLCSPAASGAT